jgi:hypothetical protein
MIMMGCARARVLKRVGVRGQYIHCSQDEL